MGLAPIQFEGDCYIFLKIRWRNGPKVCNVRFVHSRWKENFSRAV